MEIKTIGKHNDSTSRINLSTREIKKWGFENGNKVLIKFEPNKIIIEKVEE